MADVRLHLEGGDAEAAAAEIEAFVQEAFGRRVERGPVGRAGGGGEKADPVAVAGLVLSIPGAALAAMDLAERVRLREKVGRLIALAGRLRRERGVVARVATGRGLEELAGLDADRVIAAAGEGGGAEGGAGGRRG